MPTSAPARKYDRWVSLMSDGFSFSSLRLAHHHQKISSWLCRANEKQGQEPAAVSYHGKDVPFLCHLLARRMQIAYLADHRAPVRSAPLSSNSVASPPSRMAVPFPPRVSSISADQDDDRMVQNRSRNFTEAHRGRPGKTHTHTYTRIGSLQKCCAACRDASKKDGNYPDKVK